MYVSEFSYHVELHYCVATKRSDYVLKEKQHM